MKGSQTTSITFEGIIPGSASSSSLYCCPFHLRILTLAFSIFFPDHILLIDICLATRFDTLTCAFQGFLDVGFNYEQASLGLKHVPSNSLTSKSMDDIIIKGKNHWYRALCEWAFLIISFVSAYNDYFPYIPRRRRSKNPFYQNKCSLFFLFLMQPVALSIPLNIIRRLLTC